MSDRSHRWGQPTPRTQRGYGAAHDRIRRALLREEPNCRECAKEGRITKANHADHIRPCCLGGSDDRSNYQPLCTAHARSKTGREGAMIRNARRRAMKALRANDDAR
jgi:5-methylcytosine-specific restriction protein A